MLRLVRPWLLSGMPFGSSLAGRALSRAALRITVVVLIASAIGYHHVRSGMETQALENLDRYMSERRARESNALEAAEGSLDVLAEAFSAALERPAPDLDARFHALMVPYTDGTLRTAEAAYAQSGVSGFIGKYGLLTPDQRRILVTGYNLLDRLGPALGSRFANAYIITPANAMLMYWPGEPWAIEVGDWQIFAKLSLVGGQATTEEVVVTGAIESERSEIARWSGLYYDYGVNDWVVSVIRSIVQDGKIIASIGHDILVHDLIERVVTSDIDGTYNVLIDQKGRLIAHPRFMPAIQAHSGAIDIAETGEPFLQKLNEVAREQGAAGGIVDVDEHDAFVASSQLAGPGWFLITVFPKALIASQAADVAWLILGLAMLALFIELFMLWSVLRGQVGAPLGALAYAANKTREDLSAGFQLERSQLRRRDELGTLSRGFHAMIREVRKRESALQAKNDELVRLNEKLEHQLNERRRAERELARNRELVALVDTIDYGVLFLDADLKSRLANRAYQRLWKVPPGFYHRPRSLREDMEESHRQGLYAVTAEAWPSYVDGRIAEVREGDVGPVEQHLTDGTVMIYQCTALPDGGRMLTYFDITDLKHAEMALRMHLEGMEASMDGMAILDADGRYIYVNRAHARVYGYERADMLGMSWRELYDADQLRAFETTIMPKLGREGRWRGEALGKRRNGAQFPQELSLAALVNGGLVCVVRDITDRKAREHALDLAVHEAQESNAAKSRFLANMSHELRTPLNAIIGFSRIVARRTADQINETQRDNLAKIQISADQLLRLINDILDISKIEAGRTDVIYAPYSPSSVINECVRTIEPMVAKGVEVQVEAAADVKGCVADQAKIRQILTNLLSNAARHTSSGTIRVGVRREHERVLFSVADTGIGIPATAFDAIFEEFGQAPSAGKRSGTGLGLTISRRLARLMKGDIHLESEVGRGSTFTLDIPCRPELAQAANSDSYRVGEDL